MSDVSVDTAAVDAVVPEAPPAAVVVAPVEAAPVEPLPTVEGGLAYETLVIVFARFEGETLAGLIRDLKAIFAANGAVVQQVDTIGRRALAYKIQKQDAGIYLNFISSSLPSSIAGIERDLGHHEQVMRYLTTRGASRA